MKKILKFLVIAQLAFLCLSANAAWRCTVVNPVKNQTWFGTAATRAQAAQNAIKFCSRNSVNIANCNVVGCKQY